MSVLYWQALVGHCDCFCRCHRGVIPAKWLNYRMKHAYRSKSKFGDICQIDAFKHVRVKLNNAVMRENENDIKAMNRINWKIFTDSKSQAGAEKILNRVLSSLSVPEEIGVIKLHRMGTFTCTFSTELVVQPWSECVSNSLALAQSIGRGWILTGDIKHELDAWSSESSVLGVKNIHLLVQNKSRV